MSRFTSIIPFRISLVAICLSVLVTIFPSTTQAQDAPAKNVAPVVFQEHEIGKLRNNVGKEVIVQGRVATTSSSSSGHQFLNFPSGSIRVICFKDDLKNFAKGGPAALYKGKSIALQKKATHSLTPYQWVAKLAASAARKALAAASPSLHVYSL